MIGIGRIIPLSQLDSLPEGEKYFAITFDDAFRSTAENGLSFLNEMGVPSTIFIPSGCLGKIPHWASGPNNPYYLDFDETLVDEDFLRKFPLDNIEVGSHSVSHRRLTSLPLEEARLELEDSKQSLEKIMNKRVRFLSFPFNDYDDEILFLSRELGYEKVFAAVPLPSKHTDNGFLFGRIDISPRDWPVESWLKIKGGYNWMPSAIKLKKKMLKILKFS
jgi:peptidoglycan/xylan/chitin deacetylase (PgdA/CDA1 family)